MLNNFIHDGRWIILNVSAQVFINFFISLKTIGDIQNGQLLQTYYMYTSYMNTLYISTEENFEICIVKGYQWFKMNQKWARKIWIFL